MKGVPRMAIYISCDEYTPHSGASNLARIAARSGRKSYMDVARKIVSLFTWGMIWDDLAQLGNLYVLVADTWSQVNRKLASGQELGHFLVMVNIAYAEKLHNPGTHKVLEDLVGELNIEESWLYAKFAHLSLTLATIGNVLDWARELLTNNFDEFQEDILSDIGDLRVANDAILAKIVSSRKYGIKNCYFVDGPLLPKGAAWTFNDPEFYQLIWRRDQLLAVVQLTENAEDLENARIETLEDHRGQVNHVGYWHSHEFLFCGFLDKKGNIWLDGHLEMSLESILSAAGSRYVTVYPILKLVLLSHLLDLVVPVEVAAAFPSMGTAGTPRLADDCENCRPKIYLPRLRAARGEVVIEPENSDHRQVTIRAHEVVWHLRRLPGGYRPSMEATTLAVEHGITLAENETFVRSHIRGQGMPVKKVSQAVSR